ASPPRARSAPVRAAGRRGRPATFSRPPVDGGVGARPCRRPPCRRSRAAPARRSPEYEAALRLAVRGACPRSGWHSPRKGTRETRRRLRPAERVLVASRRGPLLTIRGSCGRLLPACRWNREALSVVRSHARRRSWEESPPKHDQRYETFILH